MEYVPIDKSNWTVGRTLAVQAERRGDSPFLQFGETSPVSFAETDRLANRIANGLIALGLEPGERVAVMLDNSLEYCLAWFGASRAGAVHVAVNTAYKGTFLSHLINNSAARFAVIAEAFLPRFLEIRANLPALEHLIVVGEPNETADADSAEFTRTKFDALLEGGDAPPGRQVSYKDIGAILYTSGTTGPSKGILMPHAQLHLSGFRQVEHMRMTEADVYYICMPLFHSNAMLMQLYGSLIAGCKAVVMPRFSASRWIEDIRRYGATITNLLGVMTAFVHGQPARTDDSDHDLRVIWAVPTPHEIAESFTRRFGVKLIEASGMTEVGTPFYMPLDAPYRPGSCGTLDERFFEVRLVKSDSDEDVSEGGIGELVVRPREAYCFMQGYNAMPDETLAAWRNLWFHTGDAYRRDGDGYYYFIDRLKDRIRRRGENISSFEVEQVLLSHPAVAETAVFAVPADQVGGEDEIKACVVLTDGATVGARDLWDYGKERMPKFAVPRYLEFVDELPKTPTEKVRKGCCARAVLRRVPGTANRVPGFSLPGR